MKADGQVLGGVGPDLPGGPQDAQRAAAGTQQVCLAADVQGFDAVADCAPVDDHFPSRARPTVGGVQRLNPQSWRDSFGVEQHNHRIAPVR